MLDIERAVTSRYPALANRSPLIRKPALALLRKLSRETEINHFLQEHGQARGLDFIDRIFDYFHVSYSVSRRERDNIPATGKVVIIANHPIGSLDGLALLRLVSEVRQDIKIIANDMLLAFGQLEDLFLPLDNMTRTGYLRSYKHILQALDQQQAVIVFPAGEVSRAGTRGIRDGKWQSGFLRLARKSAAPVLPVFIGARNSLLFYSASFIFKPLATALLANEMFNKRSADIRFRIGEVIPAQALASDHLSDPALIKRLKKHVYKIGKGKQALFVSEKTIAHPEDCGQLRKELKSAQQLGSTRDKHRIYLCQYDQHPTVMKEIGRLREIAFRMVGEGTGSRRDLDKYDHYYQHLVLWDDDKLAIAGAYRLGVCGDILQQRGMDALYTANLFHYREGALQFLPQAIELGRSFVNPAYWGKASLEYLWQGLGAWLRHHPHIRYVIGPVSMSASYPMVLRDLLVYYYQRYYQPMDSRVTGRHPHLISSELLASFKTRFAQLERHQAFAEMQRQFHEKGHKVPTLFKQYAALYEDGGYQLLAFSVDSDFGQCIDGLFMGDLTMMKTEKRQRYLSSTEDPPVPAHQPPAVIAQALPV